MLARGDSGEHTDDNRAWRGGAQGAPAGWGTVKRGRGSGEGQRGREGGYLKMAGWGRFARRGIWAKTELWSEEEGPRPQAWVEGGHEVREVLGRLGRGGAEGPCEDLG